MKESQLRDIWESIATEVGEKYYPKGESDRRGEFLRDQAELYSMLAAELTAWGFVSKG